MMHDQQGVVPAYVESTQRIRAGYYDGEHHGEEIGETKGGIAEGCLLALKRDGPWGPSGQIHDGGRREGMAS